MTASLSWRQTYAVRSGLSSGEISFTRSRREEREQIGVDLVLVRAAQPVRRAGIDLELRLGRELDGGVGRGADRHDLIVVAVDDQRRHGELPEIVGLVGLGERFDAVERVLEAGLHSLEPERIAQALRDLRARSVGAVERSAEVLEELRAIGKDTRSDAVEDLDGQSSGVSRGTEHQGRNRRDEDRLRDTAGPVPG